MIRYQEEEVELNDIGQFRIEVDVPGKDGHGPEIFMDVELMFSDLQGMGGPDKFQQSSSLKEISDQKSIEFKSVSLKKYQLKHVSESIFEYVPIVFEEQHFCISLCTIHSTLLDYVVKGPSFKSVGEFLLQDSKDIQKHPLETHEIEALYNKNLQEFINSYDRVKQRFSTYAAKCLTEKQRRECGLNLSAPALVLPYEQNLNQEDAAQQSEADRVRMGGRLGSQINQLRDDNSPANRNAPHLPANKNMPESIKPYASQFEENKDGDPFGEEDLSYVSGDEHDFNEQVQELNIQNSESLFKNIQNSRSNASPAQKRIEAQKGNTLLLAALITDDIKFVQHQIFTLWFKLVELMTVNPKFVCEYLRAIYEEKKREYWGEHIFRTIVETKDFS